MLSILSWLTRLIIINSKAFPPKAGAMLHAQLGNITSWTRTIMATRGIASCTPSISSFSGSENSFSIKNILNLSDEAVEQQKCISEDGAPIDVLNTSYSTPPFLVSPRLMFPLGYHHPLCRLVVDQLGFFNFHLFQPVTQITPLNFWTLTFKKNVDLVCTANETSLLKLINYSCSSYPTRASYSGQMDGFRNPMKSELKTRPSWKRFQTRMQIFVICILIKQQTHVAMNNFI